MAVTGFPLLGALYGFGTAAIPSPNDVGVFWIGNLCAPWLVLAFLAGWSQHDSARRAVAVGLMTDVACVMGFYARFLSLDPNSFPAGVTLASFTPWIVFIRPWLVAAAMGGALYGALGAWWGRSRSAMAGLSLGLPFIAEPWLWPIDNGYFKGPLILWVVEVLAGLAVATWAMTSWRRRVATSSLA